MKKLLFVCTGNICRSPIAHAITRHKIKKQKLENRLYADSAATTSAHIGQRPDKRAVGIGLRSNISFNNMAARKIETKDFQEYDLIFAMDKGHLQFLQNICPEEHRDKIHLFLKYAHIANQTEVKDPYYGGVDGFLNIFDLIDTATDNIIKSLQ